MLMQKERADIVTFGKRMVSSGLTKATGGNLSIFNPEQRLIAISPGSMDYFSVTPEDVAVVNLQGDQIEGAAKPSSELALHTVFYEKRDDLSALVHTHSVYATILSCLQWHIPAVHYLVGLAGKDIRCAPYAVFGSQALAKNAFDYMDGRRAVILANHGLLAGGASIEEAFSTAEMIEFCAEVYYKTRCAGEPVLLSDEEMTAAMERMEKYYAVKSRASRD